MSNFNVTEVAELLANGTNVSYSSDLDPEALRLFLKYKHLSSVSALVAQIVIGTLLAIGLIGNTLVIYISTTSDRIINQPVHSLLVVNLAISDLIYLVSSAPYQIIAFSISEWIYGAFLCPALHFLNNLTMCVGIYTMCTLAILRFAGLVMPFQTHNSFITGNNSKKRHGRILIIIIWLLAVILCVPTAIYYRLKVVEFKANSTQTGEVVSHVTETCIWNDDDNSQYSFTIGLLVLTYVLPGILISVLYFIVGRELLCYMNKNIQIGCSRGNNAEYWNITKIVFFLVVVFLMCWLPYNLYLIFKVISKKKMDPSAMIILKLIGFCLSYLHACINPVIYSFTLSSFQESLIKTFGFTKFHHIFTRCSLRKIAQRRSSLTILLRRKSRTAEATQDAQLSSENLTTGERYIEHVELQIVEN